MQSKHTQTTISSYVLRGRGKQVKEESKREREGERDFTENHDLGNHNVARCKPCHASNKTSRMETNFLFNCHALLQNPGFHYLYKIL